MRASEFRARAREMLSGRWLAAVLATFVASLLGANIFVTGLGSVGGTSSAQSASQQSTQKYAPEQVKAILVALAAIAMVVIVISLIVYVVGSFMSLGLISYNLDLYQGREVSFGKIFSQSGMFGQSFWLRLRMDIFIFLWMLLLIVPGIIKMFSYSMSGFIKVEHPEYSAKECMNASKQMMAGNKWRLFCLCLSFIGWGILCLLTMGIGFLWLAPYENAAITAFYKEVSSQAEAMNN